MRRHAVRVAGLAMAAFALTAQRASAQGFGVYEHDACTMGRAGTGVARPCNASAIFFNPAAVVRPGATHKWDIAVGLTSISADFAFQDSVAGTTTNSTGGAVLVPNLHVTRQLSDHAAIGLGVFAPYGLVSEWPNTFSGRFLGYRSELKTIYIQPTASFKINRWLQVGGGVDWIRSTVDLKQRVDLSGQLANPTTPFSALGVPLGTDFAEAHLTGGSWSGAYHVGVLVKPIRNLSLGIRYLSRSSADIQGDAAFTQIPTGIVLAAGNPLGAPGGTPMDSVVAPQFRGSGALVAQHASATVALPDQMAVGAAYQLGSLLLLADFQWVNWSRFATLPLTFQKLGVRYLYEDYRDTRAIRGGAEYAVNEKITVRGGLLYHQAAAPPQTVTPLLPEAERAEQTVGLSFRLNDRGRIDVAYQHINQADRRGRVVDAPRGPGGTAFNTGLYTGSANLFGASLAWGF